MSCPPGQSFDPILQDCITTDAATYKQYQSLLCRSKNMFFDGQKCVKVDSEAGKKLFDDFVDGVKNPDEFGNRPLFEKLLAQQRRPCRTMDGTVTQTNNIVKMAGTCFDRQYLLDRLYQSLASNGPFFVKTQSGAYYYPTAREAYDLYEQHIREQQRRGLPVEPMPVIQMNFDFINNNTLRFFVTPYTQRFLHIVLVESGTQITRTVGFIPRVKPAGLPAYFHVDALKEMITLAYQQGRLVSDQYQKRIPELPDTSDPWNTIGATETYIKLFEKMYHITRYLYLSKSA